MEVKCGTGKNFRIQGEYAPVYNKNQLFNKEGTLKTAILICIG
jgi:hypothetical protein